MNHYNYSGAVDNHNAYRYYCGTKHGFSLEETWKTTRWANHVFEFILAVSEVNAYLAMRYFWIIKDDTVGVSEKSGVLFYP